jgi:superfamily II RNA helicase
MKVCNQSFDITDNQITKYFNMWPFELSNFQKWALYSILLGNDTLVCAPTGSGKTLPAEFAIHYFVKEKKQKVIYTTPIKALSNEKFYNLSKKFPDISFGLLTGDNKFNPEADVLIMTTEILLNTLKKLISLKNNIIDKNKLSLDFEIDIHNELGMVIYDEIHYINDPDRGKVWEQSIMLLPKSCQYTGLSATINSPENLCLWSESKTGANRNNIFLCETHHRNVPLEHASFLSLPDSHIKSLISGKHSDFAELLNKPIILQEQNKPFNELNYIKIKKLLRYIYDNKIRINQTFIFNKMVEYLNQNNLLPALTFIFSRKQCYIWAKQIQRSLFDENSTIPSIIEKKATQILISKLPNWKEYTQLPEFVNIVKLLQKGIAVHHSGVTPVFREMIELLYNDGYIKLLIATETFAVGINMAIKSVIFTSLQKFDGRGFRFLHSHEYGQAAGRAGRRGKDTKGYIFHLNNLFDNKNNSPTPNEYRQILSSTPQSLRSKFSIDFNLIISLLSYGSNDFSNFINKSMLTNEINNEKMYNQKKMGELEEKLVKAQNTLSMLRTSKETIKQYFELKNNENKGSKKNRKRNQRDLRMLFQEHKYLSDDIKKYDVIDEIKNQINKCCKQIKNTNDYVDDTVKLHLNILNTENFIEMSENGYVLTVKGLMASNIHEIHSLAISDCLDQKLFQNLTSQEIVSVLSVFTSIRLSDNDKYIDVNHTNVNDKIKTTIKQIKKNLNKYYDIETSHQTNFTQSYDIHYDMCEFMSKWCDAENEVQCKIIYEEAKKYNIYVGEFIKAILKIVNITNELEKACVIQGNVKLLHCLSEIKGHVLKSIATNQSLYI